MNTPGEHPLIAAGLPDWLVDVPLEVAEPTPVRLSDESRTVSAGLLMQALQIEVGTSLGSFSISPELAKHFAEFTENSSWLYLPSEPTQITRNTENLWTVTVGDGTETMHRDTVVAKLVTAIHDNLTD